MMSKVALRRGWGVGLVGCLESSWKGWDERDERDDDISEVFTG